MTQKKRWRFRGGLILLAVTLIVSSATARTVRETRPLSKDVIVLKSGRKMIGKITRQTDTEVYLEVRGIELTFTRDEIQSIEEMAVLGKGKGIATTVTAQSNTVPATASTGSKDPAKRQPGSSTNSSLQSLLTRFAGGKDT